MATQLQPAEEKPPAAAKVVLVVEDNEDDFFLLRRAFQRAGVRAQVEWAKDGADATAYLEKACAEGRLPACILLDLKMPRVDGFELLDRIRSTPLLNAVPATVLTASSNPLDMDRAYRLGAKGYFVKPSALATLVNISRVLEEQWTGSGSQASAPER